MKIGSKNKMAFSDHMKLLKWILLRAKFEVIFLQPRRENALAGSGEYPMPNNSGQTTLQTSWAVAAYLRNLRASAAGRNEHPRNIKGLNETEETLNIMFYSYFRPISYSWYLLYTYHSHVLIEIGTEPLRNKRKFNYFCSFI